MPAALSSQDEVRKQSAEAVPVVAGGLSSYEIGPAIGKGGYAVVYKGIRRQDGLVVAIKRVDIDTMAAKKRERCIKEVHLLQQLNHPHILTCHDAFIDQQQLIIVTEWAPGGDMKRLIRRLAQAGKCFEEAEIWHYLRQVVDALQALHAARILHRDIKPANVLVCSGGVLKLGDLGLGRKLGPQTVEVLSKVGTPYYVSPEVVKGVKYDFKSDMWSLGCLLYELAMLRSPFEEEGANLNDVFQKISKGEYDPLPADRFSFALRGLTNALLSQEPHSRPSADLVLQQVISMQEVLQQEQGHNPPNAMALTGQPPRQTAAGWAGEVPAMSEHLLASLLVLAGEVAAAKSNISRQGRPSKSAGRSSKASSGKALVAGAGALPVNDVLQQLHPLFFAMSPVAFGGCCPKDSRVDREMLPPELWLEHQQQLQLGAAVQICSWLAELCGKLDTAQKLLSELQPAHSQPQPAGSNISRIGTANATVGNNSRAWPCCSNCLTAAGVLRSAGASLVTQDCLEAAPTAELAVGHGRAVCVLLQAVLDRAWYHLKLTCRRCMHAPEDDGDVAESRLQEQLVDDVPADLADLAQHTPEVEEASYSQVGGTSPDSRQERVVATELHRRTTNFQSSIHHQPHSHQQQQQQARLGDAGVRCGFPDNAPKETCQRASDLVASTREINGQVDAATWYAETERVANQLKQMPGLWAADNTSMHHQQTWLTSLPVLQHLQCQFSQLAPGVKEALTAVAGRATDELERLMQREQLLLRTFAGPLGQHARLKHDVDALLHRRQQKEECVLGLQQQLSTVSGRLEQVQQQVAKRAEVLQGSQLLHQQRMALQQLRQEINNMELKVGLLQHQLFACKQRRQLHQDT